MNKTKRVRVMSETLDTNYVVYQIVDSETCDVIYYGRSGDIDERISKHKSDIKLLKSAVGRYITENKITWNYKVLHTGLSKAESETIEANLILEYQPICNVVLKGKSTYLAIDNDIHRGEDHNNSKLNDSKVKAIRKDNRTSQVIADQYEVSVVTIRSVKHYHTWTHIPPHPDDIPVEELDIGMSSGEGHRNSKFDDTKIGAIRKDNNPLQVIADQYDTVAAVIYRIKCYESWSHIPPHPDDIPPNSGHKAKGTDVHGAILNEDKVRAIRKDTRTLKLIADHYVVSQSCIWRIKKRLNWAWVED